ncbi:hypothetical protein ABIE49_002449 [Bradyrhizobium sp. OAE829]
MKSAKGSLVWELAIRATDLVSAAAEKSHAVSTNTIDARTPTLLLNERKHGVVLAPVQGKVAARRPFGRPEPPLRATIVQSLVGTEEWCIIRPNKGTAEQIPTMRMVTPPKSTLAAHGQRRLTPAGTRNSGHPASWWTASS